MRRLTFLTFLILWLSLGAEAKNSLGYFSQRAAEAIEKQRLEDALDYANQEIIDYPNNPDGYIQSAIAYYHLTRIDASLSALNKALKVAQKDKKKRLEILQLKGEVFENLRDTVSALKIWEEALKIDKNNIELIGNHVMLLPHNKQKQMEKELNQMKRIAPDNPFVYSTAAYCYGGIDQFQKALTEINHAIALADNKSEYTWNKIYFLYRLNDKAWVNECIEELGEHPDSRYIDLLATVESPKDREDIISGLEKKGSENIDFLNYMAILLHEWNMIKEASSLMKNLIDSGYSYEINFYILGDCYKRLGLPMDAYSIATTGLKSFPESARLKYLKAVIGTDIGKSKEMMPILDELISESPENGDLYFQKGNALMKMEEYEKAAETLSIAVMLLPTPAVQLLYADALSLSGKKEKAEDLYKSLLNNSDAFTEIGLDPFLFSVMAASGLGDHKLTQDLLSNISLKNRSGYEFLEAEVYSRLNDDKVWDALGKAVKIEGIPPITYITDYNFYPLHTNPKFKILIEETGVKTDFDPVVNRLVIHIDPIEIKSGGTNLNEVFSLKNGNDIDEYIRQFNELCPIDMGLIGQLTSFAFDRKNNRVIYNFKSNPGTINYLELKTNPEYKRKKIDSMLVTILSQGVSQGLDEFNVRYNYVAADNADRISLDITPSDFARARKMMNSQDETDRLMLDLWLDEAKMQLKQNNLPEEYVKYDGKTFYSVVPMPQSETEFEQLALFRYELKKSFSGMLADPSIRVILPVYIRQNISVKYILLHPESGKTIEIEFTPEDLKNAL